MWYASGRYAGLARVVSHPRGHGMGGRVLLHRAGMGRKGRRNTGDTGHHPPRPSNIHSVDIDVAPRYRMRRPAREALSSGAPMASNQMFLDTTRATGSSRLRTIGDAQGLADLAMLRRRMRRGSDDDRRFGGKQAKPIDRSDDPVCSRDNKTNPTRRGWDGGG